MKTKLLLLLALLCLGGCSLLSSPTATAKNTKLSGQPVKISGVISYKFEPLQ